jgi:uncharacterized protein (TIGR02145 family)
VDNETDSINVTINRTGLTQTFINEWIVIRSTYLQYDFQDTINVNIKVHNPIIFNPNLSYGTVTDIDGNVYKTIRIGTQLWMAENLKTTKHKDNTPIPLVEDNVAWENLTTPGYCWSDNDETTYKDIYGALYNWYAVNTGKLCPQGWHVPTDLEWFDLISYLDPHASHNPNQYPWEGYIAADKMKETGTTHWRISYPEVTNECGFTALPTHYRIASGSFYLDNNSGDWWSTTEYDATHPLYEMIMDERGWIWVYPNIKTFGYSVRCLKDLPKNK